VDIQGRQLVSKLGPGGSLVGKCEEPTTINIEGHQNQFVSVSGPGSSSVASAEVPPSPILEGQVCACSTQSRG
jgi:hypothetical protein